MKEIKVGQVWLSDSAKRLEILNITVGLITVEDIQTANVFNISPNELMCEYRVIR